MGKRGLVLLRMGGFALVLTALLLGGCGSERTPDPATGSPAPTGVAALSGEQILESARVALAGTRTYAVEGSRSVGSVNVRGSYRVVDGNMSGTIRIGDGNIRFLVVDGRQYLRPDSPSWVILAGTERKAEAEREAAGRWVLNGSADRYIGRYFSPQKDLADLNASGTVVKGRLFDSSGDHSINLQDSAEPRWRADVATEGTPYPVTVSTATSSSMFDMFGAEFPAIEAPAAKDVVELAALLS